MAFKMKGFSYPGSSPIKKDIKVYEGSGNQITVDEKDLGEPYRDGDGNWTEVFRHTGRDTNCTTETITILASDYNFGTADDFKFESYASNSNKQARIHDVIITGYD